MALPTTLTGFAWPSDGIAWVGPFISSSGNVYIMTAQQYDAGGGTYYIDLHVWKASDPTSSFTLTRYHISAGSSSTFTIKTFSANQVGDVVYVILEHLTSGSNVQAYVCRSFDMSSDTLAGNISFGNSSAFTPVNASGAIVKRSTGSDWIVAYNTTGVTNMGKTYGRIAARRVSGGTSVGAETQIGILPSATTQQAESIEGAVLGSSDRVHIFWSQGASSLNNYWPVFQRTVKSTDNLDGTAPATASQSILSAYWNTAGAIDDVVRSIGQPFVSSGGVIGFPCDYFTGVSQRLGYMYATSADTPSWTLDTLIGSSTVHTQAIGNTDRVSILGGAPWDGTTKTLTMRVSTGNVYYHKNTGSGWGAATAFTLTGYNSQSVPISSNIFQRSNDIVLALVAADVNQVWKYDEAVIRTAGLSGAITQVTITLTPQAIATAVGDASRDLTPSTFTLTPVALITSEGDVTTSISPAIFTMTPVEITAQSTIEPQFASISPVQLSLLPQPLTTSVGDIASTITPMGLNLAPVALTTSIGGVSRDIGPATFTATPVALNTSIGDVSRSVSPVILTFTPQGITLSVSDAPYSLTPVALTLAPQALTGSGSGDTSRTFGVAILTLTPITLGVLGGPSVSTIYPVNIFLTPVLLVESVGGVTTSITFAQFTLTPVVLSASEGVISTSVGVINLTLTPITLTGFAVAPNEGNLTPVSFTLTPIALTKIVGGVTSSITPVQLTITPIGLTESVGGISVSVGTVTLTMTPVGLIVSIGSVSGDINPIELMLAAITLSIWTAVSGQFKVWVGEEWVSAPIRVWTGSEWIEKPLKVWMGSSWELA